MNDEQTKTAKSKEKDLVIKLDPTSRLFAQGVLDKVNEDKLFKKKLNYKELFEHLLKNYGEKAVPDLVKLREQPEDKLRLRYQKSGSRLEYQDWLEQRMTRLEEMEKKSSRKKGLEDVSVN